MSQKVKRFFEENEKLAAFIVGLSLHPGFSLLCAALRA